MRNDTIYMRIVITSKFLRNNYSIYLRIQLRLSDKIKDTLESKLRDILLRYCYMITLFICEYKVPLNYCRVITLIIWENKELLIIDKILTLFVLKIDITSKFTQNNYSIYLRI